MSSLLERLGLAKPKAESKPTDSAANSTPTSAVTGPAPASRDELVAMAAKAGMPDADAGAWADACVEKKTTAAQAAVDLVGAMRAEHAEAVAAANAKASAAAAAKSESDAAKAAAAAREAELRDTSLKIGDAGKGLKAEDAPVATAVLEARNRAPSFVKPAQRGSMLDRMAPGLSSKLALVTGTAAQGKADLEAGKLAASDPREHLSAFQTPTLQRFEPAGPLAGGEPANYDQAVEAYRVGGLSPAQAHRAAIRNYPGLHRAWIEQQTAKAKAQRRVAGVE